MQYDEMLALMGDFGRFQKRFFVFASLMIFLSCWTTLAPIFILNQPPHRCRLPDYPNDTYAVQSAEHQRLVNLTIPRQADGQLSMCDLYVLDNGTAGAAHGGENSSRTMACHAWVFDRSQFEHTLTEELGAVCERSSWRAHQYLAFSVAQLTASLLQGWLSDRWGRRKIQLLFAVLIVPVSFANAFIFNFPSLICLRFLSSFCDMGFYMSYFVIGMEIMGPRQRTWMGASLLVSWVGCQLLLAGVAFALPNWKTLTLVMAAFSIAGLGGFWVVPESPRWLITQGRHREAREVILRIAKVNGATLEEGALGDICVEERVGEKPWKLFLHPRLACRYSTLFLCWACASMVYYGLTYNVSNLSGSLYVNFVLMELLEMAGYSSCLLVSNRLGRRPLVAGSLLVAGTLCLAIIAPVQLRSGDHSVELSLRVLSLLGRFAVSTTFSGVYQHTAELYPTLLRNFGMGASSTCARLGSMLSPYIADLGLYVGGKFGQALPLVVCGGSAVAVGGLALLLPETRKKRLPDSVEDALTFGRKADSRNRKAIESDDCPEHLLNTLTV